MDFIPRPDSDYNEWLLANAAYIDTNHLTIGITAPQNVAYQALKDKWVLNYADCIAKETSYNGSVIKKKTSRENSENMARELANIIQSNPVVTGEQKVLMGLTVRKETRTAVPVPSTRPMASVDNNNRLEHIINFFDEMTKTSKSKPFGVRGCEIWCKIGDVPPKDEAELHYLATDTATPYHAHFSGADGGKTVYYWLRWVNTRNEPGPWSETISITISA